MRTGPVHWYVESTTDDPQLSRLDGTVGFWGLWSATAGFRQVWRDRAFQHLGTPGGALTSASLRAKWAALNDAIYPAMLLESARWGDERATPGYTRNGSWVPARDRMEAALAGRAQRMVAALQLRVGAGHAMYAKAPPPIARWAGGGGGDQALLGAGAHTVPGGVASVRLTAAPLIPLSGGALNSTNTSTVAPAAEVHYTTDGSDPRDEASGDAAATSTLCVLECTLAVPQQQPLTLTARSRDAQGDWSPPLVLTLAASVPSPLRVNEVADKGNASDAGCAGSDWVELRNPTASPVLLSGLVLSDDHGVPYSKSLALGGAGCPDALGGGELLLLCKDGNASVGGTSYDGCGFEFGIGGSDAVGLYQYNGAVGAEAAVLVDVTTGCCSGDSTTSFGRPAGGSVSGNGSFAVLPARTPGLPNVGVTLLGAVTMSPSRGWFSQPFNLTVTCEGAASLACTADGSDPRDANAILAAQGGAALSLWVDPADLYGGSRTWPAPAVTIRCVGAAPGTPQGSPASHTYIFSEAVLDQGEFLEGDFTAGIFWTTAMENSSDFLSREGASRAEMLAALVSLPTVSIAMPHAHLFGPDGIHRGDNLETEDLEYECSLELMYPPNVPRWAGFMGTQSPAGIRGQGGGGRWEKGAYDHKQSFGLRFRSRYGASKLQYPVFESAPLHASSAAGGLDSLELVPVVLCGRGCSPMYPDRKTLRLQASSTSSSCARATIRTGAPPGTP